MYVYKIGPCALIDSHIAKCLLHLQSKAKTQNAFIELRSSKPTKMLAYKYLLTQKHVHILYATKCCFLTPFMLYTEIS